MGRRAGSGRRSRGWASLGRAALEPPEAPACDVGRLGLGHQLPERTHRSILPGPPSAARRATFGVRHRDTSDGALRDARWLPSGIPPDAAHKWASTSRTSTVRTATSGTGPAWSPMWKVAAARCASSSVAKTTTATPRPPSGASHQPAMAPISFIRGADSPGSSSRAHSMSDSSAAASRNNANNAVSSRRCRRRPRIGSRRPSSSKDAQVSLRCVGSPCRGGCERACRAPPLLVEDRVGNGVEPPPGPMQ